jgi:hypothetical protein
MGLINIHPSPTILGRYLAFRVRYVGDCGHVRSRYIPTRVCHPIFK